MKWNSAIRCVVVSGMIALMPAAAGAQEIGTRTPSLTVASLCPGSYVRIASHAGRRTQGSCQVANGDSLQLTHRGVSRSVPLIDIDTIWLRHSRVGRGALIGGGVGAAVLTIGGLVFVNAMCYDGGDCSDDYRTVAMYGAGLGGGVGALIGVSLGAAFPRWTRRYP